MLIDQYNLVKENVKAACEKVGRDPEEVTVIAVSKTKPLSMIEELMDCGVMDFGENKVQEIMKKYEEIKSPVRWHMIGHFQTNKVKYIIDKVDLIHSVNSYSLIDELEKQASKRDIKIHILLQVNIANENSKHGFTIEEMNNVMVYIQKCSALIVDGLMMMAPHIEAEQTRPYFQQTHELLHKLKRDFPHHPLKELSMGMSEDYHIALEEGATFVRIGRALFKDEQS